MAELTHDDVQRILKIIDEMGDCDVHLEIGELKLHVTRHGTDATAVTVPRVRAAPPPAVAPTRTQASSAAEVPPGHVAIRAPTMGTFYRASSPGAKPHAEVGDHVTADDTVGVFEVMKLFSTLKAGINGTVAAIPAANEALVEQDQVLVVIKPDA
jgi:acetyl-CoA carboxylase biotin carboxyl carrier protein